MKPARPVPPLPGYGSRFPPTPRSYLGQLCLHGQAQDEAEEQEFPSNRHPANPTLPWMCLAAPWLGMQEGMELQTPVASSFRPPPSKQAAPGSLSRAI